jgi:hypothetical protein
MGIRARQARIDQGRAEVAGGESGLQGQSYEANINNIQQQSSNDIGTIKTNTANQQLSNVNDTNATFSRIQQPNYLGSALAIGSNYANYMQSRPGQTLGDADLSVSTQGLA